MPPPLTRDTARMTSNIHPVLCYDRAHDAIDWLCRAFGFTRGDAHEDDGRVTHAELHLDAATIGLSGTRPPDPSNVWTTTRDGLYVSAEDVDALHARAVAAGGEVVMPLTDTHYGSRDFAVRDPDGHLWGFGTYTMGTPPERPVVMPGLRCRSVDAAVRFLARAFGFTPGATVEDGHGRVVAAEVWSGRGVVLLGDEVSLADRWADRRQCTYVHVSDADAHHARAVAAGARVLQAPSGTPFGARAWVGLDPEGLLWSFTTHRPARPDARA